MKINCAKFLVSLENSVDFLCEKFFQEAQFCCLLLNQPEIYYCDAYFDGIDADSYSITETKNISQDSDFYLMFFS